MADNLAAPSSDLSNQRPHQWGKAKGKKSSSPVEEDIEWLIDTGADIAAVTKDVGDKFDLTATAGSASATTGGAGMLIKSGLTVEFEVLDHNDKPQTVQNTLDVAVKPDNSNSEILGMDQIAKPKAIVEWDPEAQSGRLRLR
jgi:hypothetical protein